MLLQIYHRLYEAYGRQNWWPADSPTEVVVGAILTQNTAWANVERAIANLKGADCLDWGRLRDLSFSDLAQLIKPSGTFRVKARRLKALVEVLWRDHEGSLAQMLAGPLDVARARLLAISGIGPETADAILLYAGHRPTFVVDAYTQRVLRRHFVLREPASYEATRALFQQHLPSDPALYNEYHALLVAVGKRHCRTAARCCGCPLFELPHDETIA